MFKKLVKGVLIVNGVLFLPNAIVAVREGWKLGRDANHATNHGTFKQQMDYVRENA